MRTRCEIIFTDGEQVVRYYKHNDGYPTGVLPMIQEILLQVLNEGEENVLERLKAEVKEIGLEMCFQGKREELFLSNIHVDLEWAYEVDLIKKAIKVGKWFAVEEGQGLDARIGEYEGSSKLILEHNLTNPLDYVKDLMGKYQALERIEIEQTIERLGTLGFHINKVERDSIITVVRTAKVLRVQMELKSFTSEEKAENYFIKSARKDKMYVSEERGMHLEKGYFEGFDFNLLIIHNELT